MKKVIFWGLVVIPLVLNAINCRDIRFDNNGESVNDNQQVTISEHQTKLYRVDKNQMLKSGTVNFNEKYYIISKHRNKKEGYFGVSKTIGGKFYGYIKIADSFCGGEPMKSDSGLLKKFFIKTEVHEAGTNSFVTAYPSSKNDYCGKNDKYCAKLQRFNSYYIFKEKNGQYLLSKSNEYRDEDILTGWVDKKNGYIWKTAIGIRPSDKLKDDEPVYFYTKQEDVEADKNRNEILGGDRWYDIAIRMPVLKKININNEEYYKVALSVKGIGVKKVGNSLIYVNNKVNSGSIIDKHNEVDIMFLVDGTNSMQPYIDKIVKKDGIIDRLSKTLLKDQRYKGLTVRTSYRIYRDNYAGENNLGEGKAITASCGEPFKQTSFNVMASTNDKGRDKDYEENLYGGINRAIDDIKKCSNNKKIIFVIGDAGNSDDHFAFTTLIQRLEKREDKKHQILLVFIQTPKNSSGSISYRNAYERFSRQVEDFKKALDPYNKGVVTSFKSNESNLISNILNTASISGYLNQEFLREVELNLENGENLKNIIERLSSQDKYRNIPAIYKEEIIDGSCKELGDEACEGKVYNTVMEGYIKVDDKISEDVFFIDGEFDSMINLMGRIKWDTSINRKDRRKMLIKLLRKALAETTAQQVFSRFDNKRIDKFLNEHGLPTRKNSPLFRHTIAELLDSNKVDDGVIKRLFNWINTSKQILKWVDKNKIPQLILKKPLANESDIPKFQTPIRSKDFKYGVAGYHYEDTIQNINYLWVPKEFLP